MHTVGRCEITFVLLLFAFCVSQHPTGHFLSSATVEKEEALVFRIRWEFGIGRYRFDLEQLSLWIRIGFRLVVLLGIPLFSFPSSFPKFQSVVVL